MLRIAAVGGSDGVSRLDLSCDTGEMRLTTRIDAQVLEAGSISVVLPEFLAKLKAADSPKVEISVLDAEKIMLRTSRTRWEVSGAVGHWDDEDEEMVAFTVLDAQDLAQAVSGVLPAVPKNSGRPTLERVHLGGGFATATNGSLLLKRALPGKFFDVDLSRPVASIVASLKQGGLTISESPKKILLAYDNLDILVTKPLLPYPDVSKVETAALVETHGLLIGTAEEMLASLARVRTYSDNDHPEVTLRSVQTNAGWAVVMISEDRSGNLTKEVVSASWQDEKRLHAVFHHEHLSAMLKAAGRGEVELRVSLTGKSLLIDDEERGLRAIAQQIVTA